MDIEISSNQSFKGTAQELYEETVKEFYIRDYISTARIQRTMKVSYVKARKVLDKIIKNGLAEESDGARPSKVNTKDMILLKDYLTNSK